MLYIFLKCLSRIHYSPHRALERTAFQQPLHLYNESNHKKVTRHPIIFLNKTSHFPNSPPTIPFPFTPVHFPFKKQHIYPHFHSLPFIIVHSSSARTSIHP